eukprot:NODE_1820_length_1056_cov_349.392607.p1 GENE.NODE_1820_length_1056_cov_349.392607~~NODE_1820_length_1056_cov_349.392607.p1  ORF type:complete len:287 (-),score=42.53 NODE_1820_length_1056_cov_349.392607:91-951(-)
MPNSALVVSLIAFGASLQTFGADATTPPLDCVFEGVWKIDANVILQMMKTSASTGQWQLDLYSTDPHFNNDYNHSIKTLLAKPPDMGYPCTNVRNDTQGSVAGVIQWTPGAGEMDSMWLALPASVSVAKIIWNDSPGHEVCPIADVTELHGMHKLVVVSGGCSDIVAKRMPDPLDVSLTDMGYMAVASLTWTEGMKMYIRRVIAHKGWKVTDEGGLSGFAPWYCGVGDWCNLTAGGVGNCSDPGCAAAPCWAPPHYQSMTHMLEELNTAAWVDRSTTLEASASLLV